MALVALQPGQNEATLLSIVDQTLKANYTALARTQPSLSESNFAGLTWNVQTYASGRDSLYLHIAAVDRTAYMIMAVDETGRGPSLVEHARKGFKLLPANP